MTIKEGIPENEILSTIGWSYQYFNHVIDINTFLLIIAQETNWDISARLIDDNGDVMGVYLLGNNQVGSLVNTEDKILYSKLKGVEGILLAVDSSIRGNGWGTKLKNYPSYLGFDYIWGQQLKTLNNLNYWLKRRILVGETKGVYVTLEEFK